MGKGIGLIGNFKGKVGNTVGYKLTASNNGQTQGIRVYQPIVKNPKSAGQAEQRAKLLAVNATYRALKMVIDRGIEGLPYGNKSRLAWLKTALKAKGMPWFVKGGIPDYPVVCQLTKGSLVGVNYLIDGSSVAVKAVGLTKATDVTTIGKLSTALLGAIPSLRAGDQITFVTVKPVNGQLSSNVFSFVLNAQDTTAQTSIEADTDKVFLDNLGAVGFGAVIVSREGDNGEHLRSNTSLLATEGATAAAPYDADSKAAAIASYRASAAFNSDWAEESIQ